MKHTHYCKQRSLDLLPARSHQRDGDLGQESMHDVKQIKDGKRSNLSGDSLEKRAILFTTAHLEEAHLLYTDKASHGDMFGDDDIRQEFFDFIGNLTNIYFRFDLELDKFGVDIQILKVPVILR